MATKKRSQGRIVYELPDPSTFSKFYSRGALFRNVDWSDWASVIAGFRSRFVDWYFAPLDPFPKTGDEAYPVLCSLCALVETFAHYDGDSPEPRGQKRYKAFLRRLDSAFATRLSKAVMASQPRGSGWSRTRLVDVADVFYTGVRCSLHHHGDLASYAGMSGTGVLAKEVPNAGKSRCGNFEYSTVIFDPWVLRDRLRAWFEQFCGSLEASPKGRLASHFRMRFAEDFAINIPLP